MAQSRAARYVCVGCGSEGLLAEDQVGSGRARCPQCGRALDIEREAMQPVGAGEPVLTSGPETRLLPAS